MIDIDNVAAYFTDMQNTVCDEFETLDACSFQRDSWQHAIGSGNSCILEEGSVFEKAGVNFSYVEGEQLPASAFSERVEHSGSAYKATGISMVLHPKNPYVPTAHCNLRLFVLNPDDANPHWWFGGGYDLTPYYPFMEDVITWHQAARRACQVFGDAVYLEFKQWCDRYFYLKHRNETRGVGGLFFDDLNRWEFDRTYDFIRSVGDSFVGTYKEIVTRRCDMEYGEHERDFQLYRRGRYVEFNLVYDRGTLFGLQSGGRIESILMSLPPNVKWKYDWQPAPDTKEAELYRDYLKPRDWLGLEKDK